MENTGDRINLETTNLNLQMIKMPTFDTVIGYLPVLIFLLIGWLLYILQKIYRRQLKNGLLENKKLRENIASLENRIASQKIQIASLNARNAHLETQSRLIDDQQKNFSANPFPTRKNISNQPAPNIYKFVAPPHPPLPAWTEFVDEYNGLKNLQGDNLRNAIDNFIKKYAVKCFFCEDVKKHANSFQVVLPTQLVHSFVESQPNSFFNCWLYMSSDGKIVVVPALFVTGYTDNFYKVWNTNLFDLKFVGGRPYVEFFVEKPAILNIFWEIEKKGSVKLLDYRKAA